MANAPVQRMSQLMAKTLRDDPADAEVLSHKLLVRAGYVRRTAAGVWTWLPLGKKVLANLERIVREEMDAIGAQEVLLPALLVGALLHGPHSKRVGLGRRAVACIGDRDRRNRLLVAHARAPVLRFFAFVGGAAAAPRLRLPSARPGRRHR